LELKESKWLWYAVTTAIFGILIYIADLNEFLEALKSAKILPFAAASFFGLLFFVTNGFVWYSFLKEVDAPVSFLKAIKLFLGGNFMNSVTPLGQFGGEPLMAYVVSRNSEANYQEAISSIVSADLVNSMPFVTFSALGVVYLIVSGQASSLILNIGLLLSLLIILGGFMAYLLWFEDQLLENYLFGFFKWLENNLGGKNIFDSAREKVKGALENFREFGENPRHLFFTSIVGHVTVIAQMICLYFVFLSLNIQPLIVPLMLTVVLSGLATFSPTPGGSGTFEAAFTGLIVLLMPVDPGPALAAAVLFRLTTYWPGIPLGYLALISLESE
jgi:uncharacterized protein (TIRG00374 family)